MLLLSSWQRIIHHSMLSWNLKFPGVLIKFITPSSRILYAISEFRWISIYVTHCIYIYIFRIFNSSSLRIQYVRLFNILSAYIQQLNRQKTLRFNIGLNLDESRVKIKFDSIVCASIMFN